MYIIYNFEADESTKGQLMRVLAEHLNSCVFLTDLPQLSVTRLEAENCIVIGSRRLFPCIRILRGFTVPLLSQYFFRRHILYKGIPVLIFDEIFSSTMIHAIFAKTILKSSVVIYCFENVRQPFHLRTIGRFFGKFIDAVLCSCKETQQQIVNMGVNATDVCPYPIKEVPKMEIKGVDRIDKVGFIGRLEKEKGVLLLSQAMKLLPDKKLIIAGSGNLEREVQGYNVMFLGALELESINTLYSKIDLLVVPSQSTGSWSEQYGRVIVEAMARGIIVIGSDSGAIPEIIGEPGLVFKQKSVDAIYKKIKMISEYPSSELLKISGQLRLRYVEKYSNTGFYKILQKVAGSCYSLPSVQ